jgi:hypothetical protein
VNWEFNHNNFIYDRWVFNILFPHAVVWYCVPASGGATTTALTWITGSEDFLYYPVTKQLETIFLTMTG